MGSLTFREIVHPQVFPSTRPQAGRESPPMYLLAFVPRRMVPCAA
jgi:hypothetical protein